MSCDPIWLAQPAAGYVDTAIGKKGARMRRIGRGVAALLLVGGCASGGGWPEEERVAFMENCERTSGGQTESCECLLEKVEEEYPNVADAEDMTIGEMTDMAEEC